jgi:cob(I)alamin adenosyltransferase
LAEKSEGCTKTKMSIATKTGDDGTTGLVFGRRVSKTHPRVEAYGTLDELNSALGMVRAFCEVPLIAERVLAIQKNLIPVMGELAVASGDLVRYVEKGRQIIGAELADELTAQIVDLENNHRITYAGWATPGATKGSACLDVARTVCRRAERGLIALRESGAPVNPNIIRYVNRLSDLCWLWARWTETLTAPVPDPGAAATA